MKNEPQLHHGARRIAPQSLETLIEMFALLGCKVAYREGNARWVMVGQEGIDFDIQLVEVDEKPLQTKTRISSHVAFISEKPQSIVDKVESWASDKNLKFNKGRWDERMLWFDLPDLFVDFVIEIMDRSVVER